MLQNGVIHSECRRQYGTKICAQDAIAYGKIVYDYISEDSESAQEFKDKDFAVPTLEPPLGSGPYIIDKFDKIDSIINHLARDVKAILLISILYLNLSLFLVQIQNDIWQCIMVYTQYFLFGMVALALYDLMGAMLKLVKANQIINRDVILSMSEREKKKNEEQIETDLEQ